MRVRASLAFFALVSLLWLTACGGGASSSSTPPNSGGSTTPPTQPAFLVGIEVTPEGPYLTASANQQFSALGINSDGTTVDLTATATWTVANSTLVSLSTAGLATASATANGNTFVTATSNGVTGYTVVTVGIYTPPTPTLYVDPVNGSDMNDGVSAPVQTLQAAQTLARKTPNSVVGVMNDGINFLTAPLQLTSADNGTTYEATSYSPFSPPTVISGGIEIQSTAWTDTSTGKPCTGMGTICVAAIPATMANFEALYLTPSPFSPSPISQRRIRTRTTPANACVSAGCPSYLYNTNAQGSVTTSSFNFNPGDVAANYHAMALGDVEVLDFEKWTMSRLRLLSVNTSTNSAALTSPTYSDTSTSGFFPGHRYLIENCDPGLGGVTADANCQPLSPGQWYLDRCPTETTTYCTTPDATWNLYYYWNLTENPFAENIVVPQLLQAVTGQGVSNVTFYGLTFSHDNWYPGATPITGVPGYSCTGPCGLPDQQGSPNVTAALSFTNSSGIIFNQCTFAHTAGWGLEFVTDGTANNTGGNQVVNDAFYDLGAGGLRIGQWPNRFGTDTDANVTQMNLVENNIFTGGGRVQPTGIGTGVWIGNSHNNIVVQNQVSDFYSGAIGVGFTFNRSGPSGFAHDNVVANNLLYNLGQGVTSDMGGIYFATSAASANPTAAQPVSGNLATGNVIHDVLHDYLDADGYGGNGIYLDQGASTVIAHNNLAYYTSGFGVFNNLSDRTKDTYAQNNVIANNALAFPGQYAIQRGGENPYSFTFALNIVYYDPTTTAGPGGTSFNVGIQGGHWSCEDVGGTNMAVPCNQRFLLDYNDYWNRSGAAPQFVTTMPGSTVQSGSANLALSDWQGMGEDTHSINMDPKFPNPTLPGSSNTGFAFLLATSGSSTLTFPYASPALNLGFCGIPGQQTGTCPSFFYPPQAGWFSSNQQTYTWIQYPTVQMISPPPIPAGSPTIPAAFPTETPPQY